MAATVTLGGVTIVGALIDSELNFARQTRWAVAEPLGYTGRINTAVGINPIEHNYHGRLTTAQKNSIATLATAGAAVTFVYTNDDISISQSVLIKRFSVQKNSRPQRSGYWDVQMVLEEVI